MRRLWIRAITLVGLAVPVALLLAPAGAFASLAREQREGRALVAQLRSGSKSCGSLSAADFDHIGEYAMFQALGSTSLHQVMNRRMTLALGEQGESQMHQLVGQRESGCSGVGTLPAHGMMRGGYFGGGGRGAMMSAGGWSWMPGGSWRHMTRQDWQTLEQRLVGPAGRPTNGRWTAGIVVAVAVAGVLLLSALIYAGLRWGTGSSTR